MARNKLNIIRCPYCLSSLLQNKNVLSCQQCNFTGKQTHNVVELHHNSLNIDQKTLHKVDNLYSWQKFIRTRYQKKSDRYYLNETVAEGNSAIKLWMRPLKGLIILHIGAGTGLITEALAKSARYVYAMESDVERLIIASNRFHLSVNKQKISLLSTADGIYLPFMDKSIDQVILSKEWFSADNIKQCQSTANHSSLYDYSHILNEIKRVLKENGQLHLTAKNKYGYQRLSLNRDISCNLVYKKIFLKLLKNLLGCRSHLISRAAYKRLLSISGYKIAHEYINNEQYGKPYGIQPANDINFVNCSHDKTCKQKIKNHGYIANSYSFVSTSNEKIIIKQIHEKLQETLCPSDALKFLNIVITGKHKLVILSRYEDKNIVIKVPLTEEGVAGEKNNLQILSNLRLYEKTGIESPEIIYSGKCYDQEYFVETYCEGTSIVKTFKKYGRDYYAVELFKLWKKLLKFSIPSRTSETYIDLFEFLIPSASEIIRTVTPHTQELDKLTDYLRDKLFGKPIQAGLFHGDMSVSNIFTNTGKITGLIDWEMGTYCGPVILDLLNIYTSIDRMHANTDLTKNIIDLVSGEWKNELEWRYIHSAFDICEIDESQRHAIFLSIWYWGMMQQLKTDFIYDNRAINQRINKFLVHIDQMI